MPFSSYELPGRRALQLWLAARWSLRARLNADPCCESCAPAGAPRMPLHACWPVGRGALPAPGRWSSSRRVCRPGSGLPAAQASRWSCTVGRRARGWRAARTTTLVARHPRDARRAIAVSSASPTCRTGPSWARWPRPRARSHPARIACRDRAAHGGQHARGPAGMARCQPCSQRTTATARAAALPCQPAAGQLAADASAARGPALRRCTERRHEFLCPQLRRRRKPSGLHLADAIGPGITAVAHFGTPERAGRDRRLSQALHRGGGRAPRRR